MRIVSGKYRGKVIQPPKKLKARPTTDFAKEALFNILNNSLNYEEIRVLDLFSGTGSIGFEFASRGVDFVEMIEKNHSHYEFIRDTIKNMGMHNARAVKTDAFIYIGHIKDSFDLVFADPPYEMEGVDILPHMILSSDILKTSGLFILEHSKNFDFSGFDGFFEERTYGNVHFSFFRKA